MDDGDVLKMVWNARASKEKRILPFLQAVAMLKRPYILYVYGGGNQLKKAKKFAKMHGMKAKFYGKCPRQKSLLRMKDVHLSVLASYNFDTQGMTLLEAEAMGVPVFFCDPAMMEVVPEGSYVAGSHEAFVDMMNAKLEELGIADSAHFTNCVGLYDENHYCTVYDVAVIMKAAMRNELCREFLSAHIYTTVPTKQHPEGITMSNWFLRRIEDKDTGGEVLCAKTGYVTQAGSCAVSYGIFAGGTPYICVTANATSSWRCIYDQVEIFNRYIPSEE